jgi:ribulose-5-phosphate 4-epimerase/fuculose-1-phosphate aldolase
MQQYAADIMEFVAAGRKAAAFGLMQCSSGNLSRRIGPDTALLSASGSWLGELTADEVAVCQIDSGRCLNGKKPTCECVFHLGILKHRPEVNVVLHFQSPYATAIACGQPQDHDYNMTIEMPVYIGTPAVVPYLPPGSPQLAQAVIDAFRDKQVNMAFLKNHGLVTAGKNFNDAIQKAVFFEMTCRILLTNPNAKPLDAKEVKALRQTDQA